MRGRSEQVIAAILGAPNLRAAAASLGCTPRTVQRWMKHEGFRKQYERAKAELLEGAINALRTSGWEGASTLRAIALDKGAPAAARVSAGRGLLELLLKGIETEEILKRVEALEEAVREEHR